MQQVKNKKIKISFFLTIILTMIFTLICFVILGTFYKAIEHSIGLNIIVWVLTIIIAYMLYYIPSYIICRIRKRDRPKLYNGWALLSGLLIITILCLFTAHETDDYLFLEVMGLISGVFAIFQVIYELVIKHEKIKNN